MRTGTLVILAHEQDKSKNEKMAVYRLYCSKPVHQRSLQGKTQTTNKPTETLGHLGSNLWLFVHARSLGSHLLQYSGKTERKRATGPVSGRRICSGCCRRVIKSASEKDKECQILATRSKRRKAKARHSKLSRCCTCGTRSRCATSQCFFLKEIKTRGANRPARRKSMTF